MSKTPVRRDYSKLKKSLAVDLAKKFPISKTINERAEKTLIDGGHHGLRLMKPFPPRPKKASGAYFETEDGPRLLDFWQGHYTNILGHNPPVVTSALADFFAAGQGLQTGHEDILGIEVAEILTKTCDAEAVRLTTSGGTATMNAIMLARAFTRRDLVLKVGGGWHGGQPWAFKGYSWQGGFDKIDSEGLPKNVSKEVVVTQFNNLAALEKSFEKWGDRLACFILEPTIGSGGMMPARLEYVQKARELTEKHGVLLILDEVIAGFRFRAGNCGKLYGVRPDLTTMGKIMGGGMPVAAVLGRRDVLELVEKKGGSRVKFSGGTYSAHPASMLAAKTMLQFLIENEEKIYPKLAEQSLKLRAALRSAFEKVGERIVFAGEKTGMFPASSLHLPIFSPKKGTDFDKPDELFDPRFSDVEWREVLFQQAMMLHDVYPIHGLGCTTAAHDDAAIRHFSEACEAVATDFSKI